MQFPVQRLEFKRRRGQRIQQRDLVSVDEVVPIAAVLRVDSLLNRDS